MSVKFSVDQSTFNVEIDTEICTDTRNWTASYARRVHLILEIPHISANSVIRRVNLILDLPHVSADLEIRRVHLILEIHVSVDSVIRRVNLILELQMSVHVHQSKFNVEIDTTNYHIMISFDTRNRDGELMEELVKNDEPFTVVLTSSNFPAFDGVLIQKNKNLNIVFMQARTSYCQCGFSDQKSKTPSEQLLLLFKKKILLSNLFYFIIITFYYYITLEYELGFREQIFLSETELKRFRYSKYHPQFFWIKFLLVTDLLLPSRPTSVTKTSHNCPLR